MQKRPTKYIFVTGGVVSSLGKGLAGLVSWFAMTSPMCVCDVLS